jgi:hypothetical protein
LYKVTARRCPGWIEEFSEHYGPCNVLETACCGIFGCKFFGTMDPEFYIGMWFDRDS